MRRQVDKCGCGKDKWRGTKRCRQCYLSEPTKFTRVPRAVLQQPTDEPIRYIPLTKGQVAKVDVEEFERLNKYNWHAAKGSRNKTYYAFRSAFHEYRFPMPNDVLGVGRDVQVDHINRDTLDNRKCNLRIATRTQNQANRPSNSKSGFKGVYKTPEGNWSAAAYLNRKRFYLGRFETAEKAHEAYKLKAMELHGEFACLTHL